MKFDYILISDILWYSGHILTSISILLTRNNFNLAVSFVFLGQFITIISRPIGRIKNIKNKVSDIECKIKGINNLIV